MTYSGLQIDTRASFAHFVYAFLSKTNSPEDEFKDRIRRIDEATWTKDDKQLRVWEPSKFPAEDLLAHVAHYLNPERRADQETEPTARLWDLSDAALRSPLSFGAQADWRLVCNRREIPFKFNTVRLVLFRVGVGFLITRAQPTSERVEDWLDFLHHFRFAWGRRGERLVAERRDFDHESRAGRGTPFFPGLAGGNAVAPEQRVFGRILSALLHTGSLEGRDDVWWREVFVPEQLLPFTALFVDGVGGVPEQTMPQLIYRIRNFFHASQEIHPCPDDLNITENPTLLPYAKQQWFVFSLDGGAFVACDAPTIEKTKFFRETLVDHLASHYFLLFLLSLHQRFALMGLSEAVAEHWLRSPEAARGYSRDAAIEGIRDRMLAFTARGHFSQVMQRHHHHRCYRKWQETFQIDQLYAEVSDEVRDLHEYILTRRSKQVERRGWLLNLGMFLLGPPAIMFGFLDATGPVSQLEAALAGLAAFGVGGVLFIIVDWLLTRRVKRW